jgi:hypothetical protein
MVDGDIWTPFLNRDVGFFIFGMSMKSNGAPSSEVTYNGIANQIL